MKTSKLVGTILLIVLCLLCALLIIWRGFAAQKSDRKAIETASATPVPTLVSTDSAPAASPTEAPTPVPTSTPEPTPEPTPTLDPNSPEAKALALGLPKPPEIDINSWEFVFVNAKNPLGSDFIPETASAGDLAVVDTRIVTALTDFYKATKAQGLGVFLSSGYRSYDEQNYLYNRKIGQGYSAEAAARIVTPPGQSEHQTGLCCDITDYYRESKSWQDLEPTATYQWMSQHCHEYGFIVRYPKDKSGLNTDEAAESVTGIIYEPWHYRYVGVEAATYIMENGLALEEFVALYREIN